MGCASSAEAPATATVELPEAKLPEVDVPRRPPIKTPHLALVLSCGSEHFLALTGHDARALEPALLTTVQLFRPNATATDLKSKGGMYTDDRRLRDAPGRYDVVINLPQESKHFFRSKVGNSSPLIRDDLTSLTGRAGVEIIDFLRSEGYELVTTNLAHQGRWAYGEIKETESVFRKVAAAVEGPGPTV